MLSIGALAKKTGVKVPTIRYYEQIGLIAPESRTEGNQRRYRQVALERLEFIKHARALGFSIDAIATLIELSQHPNQACAEANNMASQQLIDIRKRIASLQRLETELVRMLEGCSTNGVMRDCYVLSSLSNRTQCVSEH